MVNKKLINRLDSKGEIRFDNCTLPLKSHLKDIIKSDCDSPYYFNKSFTFCYHAINEVMKEILYVEWDAKPFA